MKLSVKKIKEVVCANRGGLQEASDSQIMIIWNSLTKETQKQYLDSVKERKVDNAISTGTE